MATRTTESTNTLETFRVNFNGLVTDIGDVTGSGGGATAGDQLDTVATTVVGAINEIFKGFKLTSQITGDDTYYLQSSDAETLTLQGGTGVHAGSETTNIVTDITAEDTMSFLLNDNITGLASLQVNTIIPTAGGATDPVVFGSVLDGSGTNYNVKFASPGDANIDYGSTQGFAAAMSVALG